MEIEMYPFLDEITSSVSTLNLKRMRSQKSRLLALTRRVQKVRDVIEQLMDDDGDMAEMYLTEKKERMEAYPSAVPYFPSSKCGSSSNGGNRIVELEMLLESYFAVIDSTFNKLQALKEYIDDTENFIIMKLDNLRNKLIQFELLLGVAAFVTSIFSAVSRVFGMNFTPAFFQHPDNFNWVLIVTSISCVVIYAAFILYFKYKRLLPL